MKENIDLSKKAAITLGAIAACGGLEKTSTYEKIIDWFDFVFDAIIFVGLYP